MRHAFSTCSTSKTVLAITCSSLYAGRTTDMLWLLVCSFSYSIAPDCSYPLEAFNLCLSDNASLVPYRVGTLSSALVGTGVLNCVCSLRALFTKTQRLIPR